MCSAYRHSPEGRLKITLVRAQFSTDWVSVRDESEFIKYQYEKVLENWLGNEPSTGVRVSCSVLSALTALDNRRVQFQASLLPPWTPRSLLRTIDSTSTLAYVPSHARHAISPQLHHARNRRRIFTKFLDCYQRPARTRSRWDIGHLILRYSQWWQETNQTNMP